MPTPVQSPDTRSQGAGGSGVVGPSTPTPASTDRASEARTGGSIQWTLLPNSTSHPPTRRDHSLTVDNSGRLFLFGGRAGGGALDDLWVFNPSAVSWSEVAVRGNKPPARFGHNAFYDAGKQRLIVTMGQASATTFFNDIWEFDPSTTTWREIGAAAGDQPTIRYGAAGASDPQGSRILVSHGFTNQGRFDDTWVLELASATWSKVATTGPVPLKRCLMHGAWDDSRRRMLLFGGQSNEKPFLGDFWSLDVASMIWTEQRPTSLPSPRNQYAAGMGGGGERWYIFGGSAPGGPVGDLWMYDIVTGAWTSAGAPATPSPRFSAALAVSGARLYLFGGHDGKAILDDLWMGQI